MTNIPLLERLEVCFSVLRGKAVLFNAKIDAWHAGACQGTQHINYAPGSSFYNGRLSIGDDLFITLDQNNK